MVVEVAQALKHDRVVRLPLLGHEVAVAVDLVVHQAVQLAHAVVLRLEVAVGGAADPEAVDVAAAAEEPDVIRLPAEYRRW